MTRSQARWRRTKAPVRQHGKEQRARSESHALGDRLCQRLVQHMMLVFIQIYAVHHACFGGATSVVKLQDLLSAFSKTPGQRLSNDKRLRVFGIIPQVRLSE